MTNARSVFDKRQCRCETEVCSLPDTTADVLSLAFRPSDIIDLDQYSQMSAAPPRFVGAGASGVLCAGIRINAAALSPAFLCRSPHIAFGDTAESSMRRDAALAMGMSPLGAVTVGDIAYYPDPGRQGPFHVCQSNPEVGFVVRTGDLKGKFVKVIAYAPGVQTSMEQCKSEATNCPLVVILHADFPDASPKSYLSYEALGKHLASHGFVVVVLDRHDINNNIGNNPASLIGSFLLEVDEGFLGLNKVLSERLVLIGHSAGGHTISSFADWLSEPLS